VRSTLCWPGSLTAGIRHRGFSAVGQLAGLVFWVQQRLPGAVLGRGQAEPDRVALAWLLPELVGLNEAQATGSTDSRTTAGHGPTRHRPTRPRAAADGIELDLSARVDLDPLAQVITYEMRAHRWRHGHLEADERHILK
jgi:hypothetical protein